MNVGEQIVLLRESKDISQKELAKHIGMHNSTLNRIEAGTRPIRDVELKAVADFFDISADYLLGRLGRGQRIPEQERELINAYDKAPEAIQSIIQTALAPYMKVIKEVKEAEDEHERQTHRPRIEQGEGGGVHGNQYSPA